MFSINPLPLIQSTRINSMSKSIFYNKPLPLNKPQRLIELLEKDKINLEAKYKQYYVIEYDRNTYIFTGKIMHNE